MSSFKDYLLEIDTFYSVESCLDQTPTLLENPLEPTKRFFRFHGNYAGPGNRGGLPIDKLDRAAFHHDVAYNYSRKLPDRAVAFAHRLKADGHLVGRLDKLARDKTQTRAVRIKSIVAKAFFASKLKLSHKHSIAM
jgi:hypothetical protein